MKFSQHRQFIFTGAICAFSLLGSAAAVAADGDVAALVEQRVRDWQPTKDERLLDQVGWAADLVEAQRLARIAV